MKKIDQWEKSESCFFFFFTFHFRNWERWSLIFISGGLEEGNLIGNFWINLKKKRNSYKTSGPPPRHLTLKTGPLTKGGIFCWEKKNSDLGRIVMKGKSMAEMKENRRRLMGRWSHEGGGGGNDGGIWLGRKITVRLRKRERTSADQVANVAIIPLDEDGVSKTVRPNIRRDRFGSKCQRAA